MSDAPQVNLRPEEVSLPTRHWGRRLPLIGALLAVGGLGLSFALGRSDSEQLAFSWLVSFLFFLSLALGATFFVVVQYLARAGWSAAVRRVPEMTMGTLPIFALVFLPLLLWMDELFPWAREGAAATDHLLAIKEPYLNRTFFYIRAAAYFAAWTVLVGLFVRHSLRQDRTGDESITRRLYAWSGLSIVVFAVTITFSGVDWIMSLDPHWFSTIFGVYFFAGSTVGFFAFMILAYLALRGAGVVGQLVSTEHFHDMGKLLFAFTVFWSYIAFSQFFLIWYGNIPEETMFFLHRLEGSWKTVTIVLAVGHFGIPFLFLLPAGVKRRRATLLLAGVWMLAMHFVDLHWLVMPNHHHAFHPSVLDLTTFLGIGGLFLAALGWMGGRFALMPVRDPRLGESLAFENL